MRFFAYHSCDYCNDSISYIVVNIGHVVDQIIKHAFEIKKKQIYFTNFLYSIYRDQIKF